MIAGLAALHVAIAAHRSAPFPQALLFRDNKSLGKLVSPRVTWQPFASSPGGQAEEVREQAAVGSLALTFSSIVTARPTTGGVCSSSSEPQPLSLAVDDSFTQHSYRVQVIGRQGSVNVVVPHSFQAEGRELTASLSVQRQWREFQQRQEAARASAGQPTSTTNCAHSSTLTVQSGACCTCWLRLSCSSCSFSFTSCEHCCVARRCPACQLAALTLLFTLPHCYSLTPTLPCAAACACR